MKRMMVVAGFAMLLAGCSQSAKDAGLDEKLAAQASEIATLKEQLQKLQAENAELRATPTALLNDVRAAVAGNDEAGAQDALARLAGKYPDTAEAEAGKKQVNDLLKSKKAKAEEAARLAALGFKALRVSSAFEGDQSRIALRSASIGGNWIFDAYGDEWHYQEPEKGHKFVTAKVTVSSTQKDPKLIGVGVYVADGGTLKRIGVLDYRFSRWDDYGSYLGNYADYRNDFAHSTSIPFSMGVEVDADAIKKPLYFVAAFGGCFNRLEARFNNPPVSYYASSCDTLASTLTVADFADGKLGVLKRLD